ncbi:hypothetical protein HCJ93_18205 [Streptomyces sp. SBST2-5]|uniref:Uncharacterized protein n=1 Tax=Streptomyces composti TaxID=2720025 RepID=A0ABX1ADT8_9ACTN|nr:hypothetical protein [Streptomyces composti]NJP51944.1 hypothetical protein [Streptomyces composti]
MERPRGQDQLKQAPMPGAVVEATVPPAFSRHFCGDYAFVTFRSQVAEEWNLQMKIALAWCPAAEVLD